MKNGQSLRSQVASLSNSSDRIRDSWTRAMAINVPPLVRLLKSDGTPGDLRVSHCLDGHPDEPIEITIRAIREGQGERLRLLMDWDHSRIRVQCPKTLLSTFWEGELGEVIVHLDVLTPSADSDLAASRLEITLRRNDGRHGEVKRVIPLEGNWITSEADMLQEDSKQVVKDSLVWRTVQQSTLIVAHHCKYESAWNTISSSELRFCRRYLFLPSKM